MNIIDADDFDLAVEHVIVCAEIARAGGEVLRDSGFRPVRVVGMPTFLWRRRGTLYTMAAAVEIATGPEDVSEQKEQG